METGIPKLSYDEQQTRFDGKNVWLRASKVPLCNDAGQTIGILGIYDDISERKATELALVESEEHLRNIMEHSPVGMATLSMNGHFLFANQAFCNLLGYSSQELIRMTYLDITHPDDKSNNVKERQQLIDGDIEVFRNEKRYLRKDGQVVWATLTQSIERNHSSAESFFISQVEDVTERKKVLDALSAQVHMSDEIINSMPGIFYLINREGRFFRVNPYFLEVTGYTEQEIKSVLVLNLFEGEDKTVIAKRMQEVFDKGDSSAEVNLVTKAGRAIPYHFSGHRARFGQEDLIVGLGTEITRRKQMEAAIQQQLLFANALNRISKTLVEQDSQQSIFENVVQVIGESLGADRVIIYEISFEREQVLGLNEWLNPDFSDIPSSIGNYPLKVFAAGIAHLLQTKTYFTSHSNNIHPALTTDGSGELLHHAKMIKSLLWFPFTYLKSGFYALVLNQTHDHKVWTSEEIAFLGSVSQLTSVALEKIWNVEQRKSTANEISIAATVFQAQEGMMVTDAKTEILRVNRAFTQITGYSAEEVIGKTPRILRSGRHDAGFYAEMWRQINEHESWEGEIWNRRKNGEIFPERITISAVRNQSGVLTNYVATITDITEAKKSEDQIRNLAFYDPLTQLPNRRLLRDRLTQSLLSNERSGLTGSMLFIDLDNFKLINDSHGHSVGDLILQETARRLKACVREGDTVSRFGGDEFVILLKDLSQNPLDAAAQSEAIGEKILAALNQLYQIDQKEFHNTTSIGITLYKGNLQQADDLLRQADIAMYQAKSAGRNTLRFFDPHMQEAINARSVLEIELRKALELQQFELYYQVQMDYLHYPIGAEALIRWIHPQRGIVPPVQFIPIAEETGLILPMGQWVLETACRQLKLWESDSQTSELVLSINVSAQQFCRDDFVDLVLGAIERFAINPNLLKLELTESLLLDNMEEIIQKMQALSECGIRFSLDDFGTGYSSLQYLKRLPLHQLKIDQSFVRDLAIDASDKAIVDTIISMAHSLRLNVIAEGVETEEQRLYLENAGCTSYQGYLFGKPVPIRDFEALIEKISDENLMNSDTSQHLVAAPAPIQFAGPDAGDSAERFEIFTWNDTFLTGIPEIDVQHRQLVNLINLLADSLIIKLAAPELDKIFNELTDYAAYHFQTEERIWHKYLGGDALEEAHNRIHNSFIHEVQRLKNSEDVRGNEVAVENVLVFLTNWLAFHILDSDKRMAMVVLAMQSGMTLEKAKQHVTRESSGSMKALIAASMSMYRQLSRQTLQLMKEVKERKHLEQRLRELQSRDFDDGSGS